MNVKMISTILIVVFLLATTPLMAQEDDFVDLNDYNLDLTIEQRIILEEELKTMVDIYGEIDLGLIKIILGELEKEDDEEFEENYDGDYSKDNFGRGLAQRIKEYKANNEDWTGQGLSNLIHNYKENNHPGNNNPGKGNSKSKNNPGKGN